MTEPKTVSNLPLDVSVRWAEDQKLLEETRPIIQDSTLASAHAQSEIYLATKPLEIDLLVGASKHAPWASFQPPEGFAKRQRAIFSSRFFSLFLGSDDHQDSLLDRIQNAKEDVQGRDNEKRCITGTFHLLQQICKDSIYVTTHCQQYQKG